MQRQTPIRRKIATETEPPMVQQAQVVSAPQIKGLRFTFNNILIVTVRESEND